MEVPCLAPSSGVGKVRDNCVLPYAVRLSQVVLKIVAEARVELSQEESSCGVGDKEIERWDSGICNDEVEEGGVV